MSYFFYCFGYSNQDQVGDISLIILFLSLGAFKSQESGGRLIYYNTFSCALGTDVERKWRTSQLLSYFSIAFRTQVKRKSRTSQLSPYCFYYFGSSSHEKVKDAELLQCFLLGFGYSSHDKVEDVSAIKVPFLLLWILKSRECAGRPNYYHTFLLLWVLESRERGGHLNCQHSFSVALDTQAKRKSRTSQLLAYCF